MGYLLLRVPFLVVSLALCHAQIVYECPYGWEEFTDHCYKFVRYPSANRMNAKSVCNRDGAYLIAVNDEAEHGFVQQHIERLDPGPKYNQWYSSGRRRVNQPWRFYWDGDGMEIHPGFEKWLTKDDKELPSPKDFIVYKYDGFTWGWTLEDGLALNPFVCEIARKDVYKILQEVRGPDYGVDDPNYQTLPRGPKFIQQPNNTIFDDAQVNRYVHLRCEVDAVPSPQYTWLRQSENIYHPIDPKQDRRFILTAGTLTVMEPELVKDGGMYHCQAENNFGMVLSKPAALEFGYLQDFPKSVRQPVYADAHSYASVDCSPPPHYPEILYSWYKDNIRNFIRPHLKPYLFISHNGRLYFSRVTKDDEGEYFCMVYRHGISKGQEGKTSRPIWLIINEAIAKVYEPRIANGFPWVHPGTPKRGMDVRIECFAWGTPPLRYSWVKVDGRLPRQSVTEDHGRVLRIPKVELIDAGEYKCLVRRDNGQGTENTVVLTLDSEPYFSLPLSDKFVDVNSGFTWRCEAEGVPTVDYAWYKNGKVFNAESLPAEDKDRISINENVITFTMLDPVKDNGMYQCSAENRHGRRFSTAELRVLSFAPKFRKSPLVSNTFATLRGNATIMCRPEMAPIGTKEWYKNGRKLSVSGDPGQRVHTLPNGHLFFRDVTSGDTAHYCCLAKNDIGEARSCGNMTVFSRTVIIAPPKNLVLAVNKTAFLQCTASSNPVLDLTYSWYKNGKKIWVDREWFYGWGVGIFWGSLYIRDVQTFHGGMYTCRAETASDNFEASAILNVVGPPTEPGGVRGTEVTATSIRMHWAKGGDNGRATSSYVIEGHNSHRAFWEVLKTNIRECGNKDYCDTIVSGLVPYSTYVFRVRSENDQGTGPPSLASPAYTSHQVAPSVEPKMVGGGGGKVGDLTITWEPLARIDYNGAGIKYLVYWKLNGTSELDWEMVEKPENSARHVVNVGSRNFYRGYEVAVRAANNQGQGPRSPTSVILSAEGMPVKTPTNIRAEMINSTALRVHWNEVEDNLENIKGKLRGYRISYWRNGFEDENMALRTTIPKKTNNGLIIGLNPHTYYWVNVMVYNTAGNGPKSQEFMQRTFFAAPLEAPTEVFVDAVSKSRIFVRWRGVSTKQGEEPLSGYKIRYWRDGQHMRNAVDVVYGRESQGYVDNLRPGILYKLRILGYSNGGDGSMSWPIQQFRMAGAGCVKPSLLAVAVMAFLSLTQWWRPL